MLSSLLLSWAAAECPDPLPSIRNAEQDAVSYFLADAESSLAHAAESFSCESPDPNLLARFFLVRAMIWRLKEDERATDALHRAKQLAPEQYTESLGDELKAALDAVVVENLAPSILVTLRGAKKSDDLWVDGSVVKQDPPTTTPGMHLVQLKRKNKVVYGRIVEATQGEPLELSVGAKQPVVRTSNTTTSGFEPHVNGPIGLKGLRDAEGRSLSMVRDVVTVASYTEQGRQLGVQRRRNTVMQGMALAALSIGPYLAYHAIWDAQVGHFREDDANGLLLANGVGLAVGGLTWEVILKTRRRSLKKQLVEEANQAFSP